MDQPDTNDVVFGHVKTRWLKWSSINYKVTFKKSHLVFIVSFSVRFSAKQMAQKARFGSEYLFMSFFAVQTFIFRNNEVQLWTSTIHWTFCSKLWRRDDIQSKIISEILFFCLFPRIFGNFYVKITSKTNLIEWASCKRLRWRQFYIRDAYESPDYSEIIQKLWLFYILEFRKLRGQWPWGLTRCNGRLVRICDAKVAHRESEREITKIFQNNVYSYFRNFRL